jgi:hypothetical protein
VGPLAPTASLLAQTGSFLYAMTLGVIERDLRRVWDAVGLGAQVVGIATGAFDYEHKTVSDIAAQVQAGVGYETILKGAALDATFIFAGGAIAQGAGTLLRGVANATRASARLAAAAGGKVIRLTGAAGRGASRVALSAGRLAVRATANVGRALARAGATVGRRPMKLGSGAFTNLRKAARNLRTRARRVRCRSRVIVQGILRLVRGIARRASRTCLAAGTAVLTPSGPQPIETLRIGDRVTTPAGAGTPGLEIGDDHRVVHLLI